MDPEIIRGYLLNNAVIKRRVDSINGQHHFSRQQMSQEVFSDPLISPYIPQIDQSIRRNAASMAVHYEIFYMLENHIRGILVSVLEDSKGNNWWDTVVPEVVKVSAKNNQQKELDAGVSLRSHDSIDYITFGELGEIIKVNWDVFASIFSSKKGVEKIMNSLNLLRGTIAHCGILSEDEVLRLKLTVRDWFRLME